MLNTRPIAMLSLGLLLAGCGASAEPLGATNTHVPFYAREDQQRLPNTASAQGASRSAPIAANGATAGFDFEVVTYNTWGKPGLLGTDEKARMELIGPAIARYDAAALQETFTRHSKRMSELSGFPFTKWQDNGGLLKLNSGLFTLSKSPIVETDFLPFKEAGDFDRFARKGVLFTRLDLAGYGLVDLYNTHYQSQSGEAFTKMRMHDNAVMAELVKKHDQGHPSFLMGDFNMTPDSPEFADLMARLPLRDTFAEAHPGDPGYTVRPDNPHKKPTVKPKRIDYMFMLAGDRPAVAVREAEVVFDEPISGKVLSDHYGLRARFTLPVQARR